MSQQTQTAENNQNPPTVTTPEAVVFSPEQQALIDAAVAAQVAHALAQLQANSPTGAIATKGPTDPYTSANEEIIFLKKDEKREYPLTRSALKGVVCFQTRKESIRGREFVVPADNLNALGIYEPKQFERHSKPGGLFDRMKINVEVWHKPGQKDTVQK